MPHKDPNARREYNQKYRAEHREEWLEYNRKYYAEHREERCEYYRKHHAEHREHKSKYRRAFIAMIGAPKGMGFYRDASRGGPSRRGTAAWMREQRAKGVAI